MCALFYSRFIEHLPGPPLIGNNVVFYSIFGGVVLLLLLASLRWLRRKRPKVDAEAALVENLGDYPPAGPQAQRLLWYGQPVRLRLVVLAPAGNRPLPFEGAVALLLDRAVYGLGGIAGQDRPQVRIWPPQLSQQGFAPRFFGLTHRPEQAGKPSPWILVAGPVRSGPNTFLLGLALYASEPTERSNVSLQADQWGVAFRVESG